MRLLTCNHFSDEHAAMNRLLWRENKCNTFAVLVTVFGVSTSAAHHPARRKRNKTRSVSATCVRFMQDYAWGVPLIFPDTPNVHISASTGPSSLEVTHVHCVVCGVFVFLSPWAIHAGMETLALKPEMRSCCSLFTSIRESNFSCTFTPNQLPSGTQTVDLSEMSDYWRQFVQIPAYYRNK